MGRDKAGLRFGPDTLLGLAVGRMARVANPVAVSAAPGQALAPAPGADTLIVRDELAYGGPLPGLLHGFRALAASRSSGDPVEAVLVMPVDLPFFDEAWMRRALGGLEGYAACLYRYEGFTNALVGAYDLKLLPKLERLAQTPKARPFDLSSGEPTRVLELETLWRPQDGPPPLMDTDTPEDYAGALKLAGFAAD
jgi:molybdopterin-guanine dinucleotide biosynthesis protein A